MNLRVIHEQLVRQIQKFGADARAYRQVYRRLNDLLPDRLKGVASSLKTGGRGPAQCTRLAFVSDEFVSHINEIVDMGASCWEARIQYETHMMLIDARRTLRALKHSRT